MVLFFHENLRTINSLARARLESGPAFTVPTGENDNSTAGALPDYSASARIGK